MLPNIESFTTEPIKKAMKNKKDLNLKLLKSKSAMSADVSRHEDVISDSSSSKFDSHRNLVSQSKASEQMKRSNSKPGPQEIYNCRITEEIQGENLDSSGNSLQIFHPRNTEQIETSARGDKNK